MENLVSERFETMQKMLNDIQIRILGVDPSQQLAFIQPIYSMILEAHLDASNNSDTFLFPSTTSPEQS